MSSPTTSSPQTALSFDVGNLEPSPIQIAPQQNSAASEEGPSSASFHCGYCSQAFSKQYELTLAPFRYLKKPNTAYKLQEA
jgi:hypothetical protein